MCGQQSVRASAKNNTGRSTDKKHTSSLRKEVKIPNLAGVEPATPGLKASIPLITPRRRTSSYSLPKNKKQKIIYKQLYKKIN